VAASFLGISESVGKGITLTWTIRLSFLLCTAAAAALGQAPGDNSQNPTSTTNSQNQNTTTSSQDQSSTTMMMAGPHRDNPVAEVRERRSWEVGPFFDWGTGVGDRSDFKFVWVGAQLGKVITPVVHAGILSGQFEFAGEIMPFWQAYTPAPHDQTFLFNGQVYHEAVGGGTYTGVSLEPVIFRWNFLTRSRRIQPWFQAAGGLIYTTHKFPPDVLVPHGTPGATSVWNFSPQGGVGAHYFLRSGRSIDIGVNAVHISSASLGDHNPGVNASLQVQVGYTWWK
jgi:lipid A 3-O-deacylase